MDNEEKKPVKEADLASMLNLGSMFDGVAKIMDRLGTLAEQGERLRASANTNEAQAADSSTRKPFAGEYGFKVRFGLPSGDGEGSSPSHVSPTVVPRGPQLSTGRDTSTKTPEARKVREATSEFFDEGEHSLMIAEMPGVMEKDVSLEIGADCLIVRGRARLVDFYCQFPVTGPIAHSEAIITVNNGIVEVRLTKPEKTPVQKSDHSSS